MYDRIMMNPQVVHGQSVVRGTRVPVAVVLGHVAGGESWDAICDAYGITPEDIAEGLAFAARRVELGRADDGWTGRSPAS